MIKESENSKKEMDKKIFELNEENKNLKNDLITEKKNRENDFSNLADFKSKKDVDFSKLDLKEKIDFLFKKDLYDFRNDFVYNEQYISKITMSMLGECIFICMYKADYMKNNGRKI